MVRPKRVSPSRVLGRAAIGLALLTGGLGALTVTATPAGAASLVVSNCHDSGAGSLRQAVRDSSSGDSITIPTGLGCSGIGLTSGAIEISASVSIDDAGGLAVSGDEASQVFVVESGSTATISGFTIENGSTAALKDGEGAGIDNAGTLTLNNSTISNDTAYIGGGINNSGVLNVVHSVLLGDSASDFGGGIANSGTLTVSDSFISDNSSGEGGGGIMTLGGTTSVTDSRISENTGEYGAGMQALADTNLSDSTVSDNSGAFGAGIYTQYGTFSVADSTVASNSATEGGGIYVNGATLDLSHGTLFDNAASDFGGGLFTSGGVSNVAASIVAGSGGQGSDCRTGSAGGSTTNDDGYNADDDGSCGFSAAHHSISDSSALDLGPLANNGGSMETVLPEPGSPTIGVIPPGTESNGAPLCPQTDQRGVASVGDCTMGALEGGFLITTTSLPNGIPGAPYQPLPLTVQEPGVSTSPYETNLTWTGVDLPTWLSLTSSGSLSGTPHKNSGTSSITVRVTETVKTVVGGTKVRTRETVQASIPLVVSSVPGPLEVVPRISAFPTVTVGERPYPPVPGQPATCTGGVDVSDFAQIVQGTPSYFGTFSAPQLEFGGHLGELVEVADDGSMAFGNVEGGWIPITGTPGGEPVQNTSITFFVRDANGSIGWITFPWTIENPDGIVGCYWY